MTMISLDAYLADLLSIDHQGVLGAGRCIVDHLKSHGSEHLVPSLLRGGTPTSVVILLATAVAGVSLPARGCEEAWVVVSEL
jgi:hypothetical protein